MSDLKTDKAHVLTLDAESLKASISSLQVELFKLRLAVVTSEASEVHKIKFIRKQIARRIHRLSQLAS